jgi:hypothetical protein
MALPACLYQAIMMGDRARVTLFGLHVATMMYFALARDFAFMSDIDTSILSQLGG